MLDLTKDELDRLLDWHSAAFDHDDPSARAEWEPDDRELRGRILKLRFETRHSLNELNDRRDPRFIEALRSGDIGVCSQDPPPRWNLLANRRLRRTAMREIHFLDFEDRMEEFRARSSVEGE